MLLARPLRHSSPPHPNAAMLGAAIRLPRPTAPQPCQAHHRHVDAADRYEQQNKAWRENIAQLPKSILYEALHGPELLQNARTWRDFSTFYRWDHVPYLDLHDMHDVEIFAPHFDTYLRDAPVADLHVKKLHLNNTQITPQTQAAFEARANG